MKTNKPYFFILLVVCAAIFIGSSNVDAIDGEPGTAKIHESGWDTPIKLQFNDNGWQDSPYITRDGSQILFFYHPWGNLADPQVADKVTEFVVYHPKEAIEKGIDGKVYFSDRPFINREIHPISQNKKYPSADACPYISERGDVFYTSTKESFVRNKSVKPTAYRNGKRLDFGTNTEDEGNPHYCDAKDEMWFDCPGDQNICVMRNATKSNFKGKAERAPYPINDRNVDSVVDSIPFLTDDCRTLYFTSTRSGTLAIYKTTRQDEDGRKWSNPKQFVSHQSGVAELSMTSDGNEMVFSQVDWRNGGVVINTYYSSKKGYSRASSGRKKSMKQSVKKSDDDWEGSGYEGDDIGEAIEHELANAIEKEAENVFFGLLERIFSEPDEEETQEEPQEKEETSNQEEISDSDEKEASLSEQAQSKQSFTDLFVGIGGTTSVETLESYPIQLRWNYKFSASNFPMIIYLNPEFTDIDGLEVRLRSDKDTKMAFILTEPPEVNYDYHVTLPASRWITVKLPWKVFKAQDESLDGNRRLDIDNLKSFALFDIGAFEGKKGKNTTTIQYISEL